MFFKLATDGTRTPAPQLLNSFAGPTRTACWLIGGGPSLPLLDCRAIAASPLPKFGFNLNGHGLIRPTIWTYYDESKRFDRSTFLDPSVLKFAHTSRANNVIPGTTHKVCDAPNLYFFDRDPQRGFHDFLPSALDPQPSALHGIVDWNDSMVQAIDIAFRLGFRTLYCVGTDLHIAPSGEQLQAAELRGVEYRPREPLRDFYQRLETSGLARASIDALNPQQQYHFGEQKNAASTVNTDLHYFRVAQYLRLSQRAIALAGLELISCTPRSRLNDYFEFATLDTVLRKIHASIGNPLEEQPRGRYTDRNAQERPGPVAPMRDFKPHHWPVRGTPATPPAREPPEVAVPVEN